MCGDAARGIVHRAQWIKNRTHSRKGWPSYVLWLVGTSRNALVVLLATLLAYILARHGHTPFSLLGTVPSGFPTPTEPGINTSRLQARRTSSSVRLSLRSAWPQAR